MTTRPALAAAALALLVAGCGGTTASSSNDRPSSSTPSPSPKTKETVSCQPLAQEFVDRYTTVDQRAKAGTLDIDALNAAAKELRTLGSRMDKVCSPKLTQAAAMANYQTALAVGYLTACAARPSVCKKTQNQAGDAVIAAVKQVGKVDALLHPTA